MSTAVGMLGTGGDPGHRTGCLGLLPFRVKHLGLDLNSLNTVLFGLALLAHRNVANFNRALQTAILSCWPIAVMYHLYGGVAGLLQFTTLGGTIGGLLATVATRHTFPFFTALISIGDQMGNMLTPFWAAVGAGIARIDFRRFIGYQFAYAAIRFVLGVLVFTLL